MGTLQNTLSIINNTFPFLPILMTNKDKKIFDIYNKNGYAIDNIHLDDPLKKEIIEIKDEKKYIKFYRNKSVLPSDTSDHISIRLKSVYHRNSGPLTVHGDNSYTVAISDHADFNETIEYIQNVKPKYVFTDPATSMKNASNLSKEIIKKLRIESKPAKVNTKYEWGK
jgi:Cft2 family RNA processing exonuclease